MPSSRRKNRFSFVNVLHNGERKVVVERPVYSEETFKETNGHRTLDDLGRIHKFTSKIRHYKCTLMGILHFVAVLFPFIGIMQKYNVRSYLPSDILVGLTVAIMHVPQGMAYGLLATLPPVYGLYVSFFPVIIYFLLGTSRHISIGTLAVTSLMVGAVADKGVTFTYDAPYTILNDTSSLSNLTESDLRLEYALSVTFFTGLIQFVMGLTQLGFLVTYLSDPLISGFTTAAAFHVCMSQINHVFGLTITRHNGIFKLPKTLYEICKSLPQTNVATLIISISCIVILVIVKECINKRFKSRLKIPVPIELIVLSLLTVISYFMNLSSRFDVAVVGEITQGIPPPRAPSFNLFVNIIGDSFAIAVVAFAINVSLGKILSKDCDYKIDANQELLAYGACNIIGSFFNSFVSAASLSRSLVQKAAGGKTQVTGLISCGLLLAVLLEIGPHISHLPKSVLASIVIVNLKGMFIQFAELPEMWKVSKYDCAIWIVTWASTTFLDVDLGLGIGVLFSFLTVLNRSQTAYVCLLGRIPHTDIYRDISLWSNCKEVPGVKIVRFQSPLFYANVDYFKRKLITLCDIDPSNEKLNREKLKQSLKCNDDNIALSEQNDGGFLDSPSETCKDQDQKPYGRYSDVESVKSPSYSLSMRCHHIILDCSMVCFIDSAGVKVLAQIISDFEEIGITILLVSCKNDIRKVMNNSRFFEVVSRGVLFFMIHDAVIHAVTHDLPVLEHRDEIVSKKLITSDIAYPTESAIFVTSPETYDLHNDRDYVTTSRETNVSNLNQSSHPDMVELTATSYL